MVFLVKMDLLDPWVQGAFLVREEDQDFLELQGLEVMTVLEGVMDNQVHLVPLELQDFLVLLVLRVKMDLRDLLALVAPLDKEENLDPRDLLVLRVLRVLLAIMAVLVVKVKWVLLEFLVLLGSQEAEDLPDLLVSVVLLDREVVQVNLVRMVPKESQDHVVNVVKLVLQALQELRVKMAKTGHLENLVLMGSLALQESGVQLDSEVLLEQMAFQEKRALLESAVAQVLQGPEDLMEKLVEMVSLDLRD